MDAPEPVLRRIQVRIVPALEALLAAALERDALMADAVETAALRRSDVIKTALLRSVSHDLRSPLTAILTSAEALRIDPSEREELAAAITEEATRLSRLIDNLLDLSRLEADAAEPRPEWSSIEEVLGAAIETVPGEFKLAVDGDLPPVRADAAQLERAFANLLENAQRHSGGHPVSVRARDVGGRILVRVVDRGPGIPKAQQDRIFEPFYRSGTDATGHRGSGLGPRDRARLRRGQRRPRLGRVAARPGDDVRGRAAGHAPSSLWTTRSISLIPTNGAIRPPTP